MIKRKIILIIFFILVVALSSKYVHAAAPPANSNCFAVSGNIHIVNPWPGGSFLVYCNGGGSVCDGHVSSNITPDSSLEPFRVDYCNCNDQACLGIGFLPPGCTPTEPPLCLGTGFTNGFGYDDDITITCPVQQQSNYCLDAGYYPCTPGAPTGDSCQSGGQTCTEYEHYACNFEGEYYCDSNTTCGQPCSGGDGTPPGTCSLSVSPSSIGIGSYANWSISSNPVGSSAQWRGTDNGSSISPSAVAGYPNATNGWSAQYQYNTAASYIRWADIYSGGSLICTTNQVSLTVSSNPTSSPPPSGPACSNLPACGSGLTCALANSCPDNINCTGGKTYYCRSGTQNVCCFPPPNCNTGISCSGVCSAPANTCYANNGSKSGCTYTTHTSGGSCVQTTAPNQTCTLNNCSAGYSCVSGICSLPPTYPVSGTVFNDTNGNEIQDSGESGVAGVTINFTYYYRTDSPCGSFPCSATTNSFGQYSRSFGQENYNATITVPNGYTATTQTQVYFQLSPSSPSQVVNFGIKQSSDLVVTAFYFTDSSGNTKTSFASDESIYPSVTIQNVSSIPTSSQYGYFYISFYSVDPASTFPSSDVNVWVKETGSIGPGASKTYSITQNNAFFHNDGTGQQDHWSMTTGNYTARAYVDSFNFVTEIDENNNQSVNSYFVLNTPPGAFAISNVNSSCTGGGSTPTIALNWTSSAGATSYTLSRSPTGSSFPVSLPSSSIAYSDQSFSPGTSYSYFLQASNTNGSVRATWPAGFDTDNDGWSNPITPPDCSTPSAPGVDLKINGSDGPVCINQGDSANLSWVTAGSPTSCAGTGAWSGSKSVTGGSQSTGILSTSGSPYTFTITCSKPGFSDAIDSVTANVSSTGCASTITPWIQTDGDVHSQTNINTPGGP